MRVFLRVSAHGVRACVAIGSVLAVTSCGGGADSTMGYSVGGTVSGLITAGLVLENNSEVLTVGADAASFTFRLRLDPGAGYAVTVQHQPTTRDQLCDVGGGSGTMGSASVTTVSVVCRASQWAVSTLAGTGAAGAIDGAAHSATFDAPFGVAVDVAGNLYVADGNNLKIRKITPSGAVTTLAGSGGSGHSDGIGAEASFSGPYAVAVDSNGNVYVAEPSTHTIRRVDANGVVTTLAGSPWTAGSADGAGAAALFSSPRGVAVDGTGNVYVADSSNSTIRKITPAGLVSTLAGSSGAFGSTDGTGAAALFRSPFGTTVDASGNVYVADVGNLKIRKITSAGVVTTLAGSGVLGSANGVGAAASFNGPLGVAVDAVGVLYLADVNNNRIRKVVAQ